MNECKCPLNSECNARRGYFDCAKKLIAFVEQDTCYTCADSACPQYQYKRVVCPNYKGDDPNRPPDGMSNE